MMTLFAVVLAGSSCVLAQNKKKSTTAAPPPTATTVQKSANGVGGNSQSGVHGPSTGGPTIGSRGNTGPTLNSPGGGPPRKGSAPVAPVHPPTPGGGVHPTPIKTGPNTRVNAGIGGRPAPARATVTTVRGGGQIQRRPDGRVSDVHDPQRGMDIHHGLDGRSRVVVERADHTRIVAERGRPGYISHRFAMHGHDFARRTYFYRGRTYSRFYRPYYYRGAWVDVYAPSRYYPFGFYGWAYAPWGAPVVYAWGWGGAAWSGYYGFYFAPSPFYASPSLWLSDYMVSQDLAANYQAAQDSNEIGPAQAASGGPELTPEVKQQIANEVAGQISLEYTEAQQNAQNQNNPQNADPDPASSGIQRLLADGRTHVFVVGGDLDLVDSSETECAVSGGDVLELTTPPPSDAQAADLVVLASKSGNECPKSDTVTVAFTDLQEMQNHMRETVDQGLDELRTKQGTGGLPPAPPSAQQPYVDTTVAQFAPPPDPSAATEINQQMQQADAAEKEVAVQAQQEAGSPVAPMTTPPPQTTQTLTISRGQTIDQVTAAMGQPLQVFDLGAKKIYQYQGMKIVFQDGKVADVQ